MLHDDELTFPFQDNTLFRGLEAPVQLLAQPRALRRSYLEAVERFLGEVRFPISGPIRYSMTAHDGLALGRMAGADRIVPVHYEGWSHFSEGPSELDDAVAAAPSDVRSRVRVLVPGEPRELADKMPQGVNLNSFPTSFILGRDCRVRSVHAGFPGKASGDFHTQVKSEVTSTVERLLAERPQSSSR